MTGENQRNEARAARGVITRVSQGTFEETLDRAVSVIKSRGLRLFEVIDHQGAAAEVGLALRPTQVLVFGSPTAGTPLMVERPLLALELPLRILVWEAEDGQVCLSCLDAEPLISQFELDAATAGPLRAPVALIDDVLGQR